jgi:hypothetical protein
MTRGPDFDELVGHEADAEERERLRRVHDLLVQAGPPPELSPELAAGPTLAMTLGRRPGRHRRRLALLAAATVALLLVFLGGYLAGNRGGDGVPSGAQVLELQGTSAVPGALASLRIDPADAAGNRPMTLAATGLPALRGSGYYEVYLVRDGKPYLSCGVFTAGGTDSGVTVSLNAPYAYRAGDTWIVTEQLPGGAEPGPTVLRPTA